MWLLLQKIKKLDWQVAVVDGGRRGDHVDLLPTPLRGRPPF
nr:MAG TPA: hypothetical protein [Caudoviricetes sp.]